MSVAWQSSGTLLGGLTTADVTPVNPAHQADDILICVTANRVITNTCATPAGWTLLFGPVDETAWRSYVFWKRATTSSEANPLCNWTATSADKYAQVHCINGAVTSGDPFVDSAWTDGAANPAVATGVTTVAANQYVLSVGLQADNLAASMTSVTATDPAALTQRHYSVIATGADAGGFFFDGIRTTAGATGNVNHTFSAAPLHWGIMVAAVTAQPGPNVVSVGQVVEADTVQPITVKPKWPVPIDTHFLSTQTGTVNLTTPTFTPTEGEIIVVKESTESGGNAVADPTGGGLTFTRQQEIFGSSVVAYAALWTATVGPSPTSMSITASQSSSTNWSALVERWPVGTTLGTLVVSSGAQGTGAPLTSITTTAENSTISWASADWNATAPGTPVYRDSAVQEAIHDRSPNNYVAYYAYQGEPTAGSHDFGLTSPVGQKWSAVGIELKLAPVGGGGIVAVNQAIETDTAQPITRTQIKTVGQAIETDTPQAITRRKSKTVLQVTETDTAQLVTKRKLKTVLQVTETDTGQPVTKRKIKSVLQTLETDTADTISRDAPIRTVNLITEVDTAQPITQRKIKVVGQVIETDSPQPIRRQHRRTLGQPIETDTATTVGKRKTKLIGQTVETDLAQNIKIMGRVFQVIETDTAQKITAVKRKTVLQVTETDTVTPITKRKVRTLGQPVQVNTAMVIIKPGNKIVLFASEVDTAQRITALKRKTIGQTIETDSPFVITKRRLRLFGVGQVGELDTTTALLVKKRIQVQQVTETDIARIVNFSSVLPPPPEGYTAIVIVRHQTVNVIVDDSSIISPTTYVTDVVVEPVTITVFP